MIKIQRQMLQRIVVSLVVSLGVGVVNVTASAATPAPSRNGVGGVSDCLGWSAGIQTLKNDVVDKTGEASAARSPMDASLVDYLERHGRIANGDARTALMPWTALHQSAN